jgi:hypothetical protein
MPKNFWINPQSYNTKKDGNGTDIFIILFWIATFNISLELEFHESIPAGLYGKK